jgi:hypothetical protein
MRTDLDAKFAEYHHENPDIYAAFKRAAFKVRRTGRTHFGAKCIMEYVRFQTAVSGAHLDGFKINNNFTSRYVRMLETDCPEFDGFFEKRQIRS